MIRSQFLSASELFINQRNFHRTRLPSELVFRIKPDTEVPFD